MVHFYQGVTYENFLKYCISFKLSEAGFSLGNGADHFLYPGVFVKGVKDQFFSVLSLFYKGSPWVYFKEKYTVPRFHEGPIAKSYRNL